MFKKHFSKNLDQQLACEQEIHYKKNKKKIKKTKIFCTEQIRRIYFK